MNKKVKVLEKQNLMDISVQETGTIDNIFLIADSNGISISDDLIPGSEIIIPETVNMNKKVTDYLNKKNIKPGTNGS